LRRVLDTASSRLRRFPCTGATCLDNAVAESFFGTLKRELVHRTTWVSREQAKEAIHEYIEVFYNRWRRHSTLGYVCPAEYERNHNQEAAEAA
jgi:transposase InsO family protein